MPKATEGSRCITVGFCLLPNDSFALQNSIWFVSDRQFKGHLRPSIGIKINTFINLAV